MRLSRKAGLLVDNRLYGYRARCKVGYTEEKNEFEPITVPAHSESNPSILTSMSVRKAPSIVYDDEQGKYVYEFDEDTRFTITADIDDMSKIGVTYYGKWGFQYSTDTQIIAYQYRYKTTTDEYTLMSLSEDLYTGGAWVILSTGNKFYYNLDGYDDFTDYVTSNNTSEEFVEEWNGYVIMSYTNADGDVYYYAYWTE